MRNIQYTGMEISADKILNNHTQNKPSFWPVDWSLMKCSNTTETRVYNRWLRNNCQGQWQTSIDGMGDVIIAFEHEDDAVLFKLSF